MGYTRTSHSSETQIKKHFKDVVKNNIKTPGINAEGLETLTEN